MNADSVTLANTLWRDPSERSVIVNQAEVAAKSQPSNAGQELEKLKLPIGWSRNKDDARHVPRTTLDWVSKVAGIAITWLAISRGAPFWFDLLKKLVNLRSAGKSPADAMPVGTGP